MSAAAAAAEKFNSVVQSIFDQAGADGRTSGISWNSFGKYLDMLKVSAMLAAKDLAVAGYQKKQYVMSAIESFIDNFLPLPTWLFFLRTPIKNVLLSLADGAIEALYKEIIEAIPSPTPAPAPSPAPSIDPATTG